jgi:hypothetical protein
VTLAELLVALVIMSVIAGVATLSLGRMPPALSRTVWRDSLASARKTALAGAHRVTLEISVKGQIHHLTVMPDGQVIADPLFSIDPLTGEVSDAAGK